jgi:hypothetical protein
MHRVESLSAVSGKAVGQSWREMAGARWGMPQQRPCLAVWPYNGGNSTAYTGAVRTQEGYGFNPETGNNQ